MRGILLIVLLSILQISIAQNVIVEGTIQLTEGAQPGYILKSDANGIGKWSPPNEADRRQIFVSDFGAKGDSQNDDTQAFQTAIDSAAIYGGTVHIPTGDYKITATLQVPGGVQLRGQGLGNTVSPNGQGATGSRISYWGSNSYAIEFLGELVGGHNLAIRDAGGMAAGGINYSRRNSSFGVGASFSDLLLTGFSNGTALKLEALGTSGIAWSSFENIHIQDAKKGIHIEVAADGSFINLLTFRSITITGEGYEYGVLIDGPLSTTDWYGIALQAACPTKGHLVLNTNGAVNMYGVDITSSETSCNDQTLLIHLSETTRGSYIHGRAGKGSIIDLGSNFIDLAGASSLGVRPSGTNLFQNAAFNGFADNILPYWEFNTNSGYTLPNAIETEAAEWKDNHQVLKLTIGAGRKANLSPQLLYFTQAYQEKECLFGAMVKTDAMDIQVFPAFQACGGAGFTSGSTYPNDNLWRFIGKPSEIGTADPCQPRPQFIFDNTTGSSPAIVYITTPTFVFNRGEKPALESSPITSAGGIITGTLTTGFSEGNESNGTQLQLEAAANVFQISGIATIQSINETTSIFPQGTVITLLFEQAGTEVIHADNQIKLLGATDYVSEAFSTLQLLSFGDGTWQETDRNCSNGCQGTANRQIDDIENELEQIVVRQPNNFAVTPSISIYPNPTKYGIHVVLQQSEPAPDYALQLLDSQGRTLMVQPLVDNRSWIDFGALHLAAGQYQLNFMDGNGVFETRSLLILPE